MNLFKGKIKYFTFFLTLLAVLLSSLDSEGRSEDHSWLTTEEQAWIDAHPQIRVANEMDWPPFDYNVSGEPRGLAIDYINLLAEKSGIELQFIYGYSWHELNELFMDKKIDLMPVYYKNEFRESFTLYSPSYFKAQLAILINKDNRNWDVDSPENLIGIEKSNGSIFILEKIYPGTIVELEYKEDMVRKLALNELDALIGNPFVMYHVARENQIDSISLAGYVPLEDEDREKTAFHLGVRDDWPMLLQILEKAQDRVSLDEMKEITSRWADISIVRKVNWRIFVQAAGGVTLILLLLLWYNRILKRRVADKTKELQSLNDELEIKIEQRTKALKEANIALEEMAMVDPLTGLKNRRAMDVLIEQEIQRSKRFDRPVSILVLDLDKFKRINDDWGHSKGDAILSAVGKTLLSLLRATDYSARWGGEEFLILASETDETNAFLLGEKIRKAIEDMENPELPDITVSIGVTQYEKGEEFSHWFERADSALYAGKESGRNRVIQASAIPDEGLGDFDHT
ncbi:MAG: diguanylate cyclase [Spirochaetales bacterium]|nr:diguanylate cyclase [Spirochaetales bacterium]